MTDVSVEERDQEHPGVELGRVLSERGIADSALADQGGLSRPLVSQITNGNRRITSNSATKICRVIGGDPMYWVRRQRAHDLWRESEQIKDAQLEHEAELAEANNG